MASHYGILAGETPWTEEPGGLQPMGSQRVRDSHHRHHHAVHTTVSWVSGILEFQPLRTKGEAKFCEVTEPVVELRVVAVWLPAPQRPASSLLLFIPIPLLSSRSSLWSLIASKASPLTWGWSLAVIFLTQGDFPWAVPWAGGHLSARSRFLTPWAPCYLASQGSLSDWSFLEARGCGFVWACWSCFVLKILNRRFPVLLWNLPPYWWDLIILSRLIMVVVKVILNYCVVAIKTQTFCFFYKLSLAAS